MKEIFPSLFLVIGVAVSGCWAEASETEAVTAAKASVFQQVTWFTSYDAAKAEADRLKVPILMYFAGSDWCVWCMKLDKEVFSSIEFQQFALKNLVLLLVDRTAHKPQPKALSKQNARLADEFGIQGRPTVLLLDSKGNEFAMTGYRPGGGEGYVKHLKELINGKENAVKEKWSGRDERLFQRLNK